MVTDELKRRLERQKPLELVQESDMFKVISRQERIVNYSEESTKDLHNINIEINWQFVTRCNVNKLKRHVFRNRLQQKTEEQYGDKITTNTCLLYTSRCV